MFTKYYYTEMSAMVLTGPVGLLLMPAIIIAILGVIAEAIDRLVSDYQALVKQRDHMAAVAALIEAAAGDWSVTPEVQYSHSRQRAEAITPVGGAYNIIGCLSQRLQDSINSLQDYLDHDIELNIFSPAPVYFGTDEVPEWADEIAQLRRKLQRLGFSVTITVTEYEDMDERVELVATYTLAMEGEAAAMLRVMTLESRGYDC